MTIGHLLLARCLPGLPRRAARSATAAALPAAFPGHDLLPAIGQATHGLSADAGVSEVAGASGAHGRQVDHAFRWGGTSLTPRLLLQNGALQPFAKADHARMGMTPVRLAVERRRV